MIEQPTLFPLPPAEPPTCNDRLVSLTARKLAVFELLRDGEWHATHEFNTPEVGGSDGVRRLRQLRADFRHEGKGRTIEMRRKAESDEYEYRLTSAAV